VPCTNIPEKSVDYADKGSADLPRRLARPASSSDLASAFSLAQPASLRSSSAKQQIKEILYTAFAVAWPHEFATMLCMACLSYNLETVHQASQLSVSVLEAIEPDAVLFSPTDMAHIQI